MSQRLAAVAAALLLFPATLTSQARDSLAAGRRAYESAEYAAASRLLQMGVAGAGRDSAWATGVHMLTDVLLEQGADSSARLWARWANRAAPGFRIDSTAFPPRVTRVLRAARADVGAAGADTAVHAILEPLGDPASSRGQLRLGRGNGVSFVVIEGLGTMLPGESRTLPAATYTVRVHAEGFPPLIARREVLPGFATLLAPRPVRVAASAALPGAINPIVTVIAPVRGSLIGAAGSTTCTIQDAATTCWGADEVGQLGGGFVDSTWHAPVTVASSEIFRAVSAAAMHACALTESGKAWCWGFGGNGELGTGRPGSSPAPVAVAGSLAFAEIAAGGRHSCGLTRSGAAHCWGANAQGQLGNRSEAASAAPVAVTMPAGVTFTTISAGTSHSCALTTAGAVYCWGANEAGQIGNGSTSASSVPVLAQTGVTFKAVAASGTHSCALSTAGAAYCWGANGAGQAGTGAASESETRPAQVTGGLVFDSIVTGEAHSCGLTADGAAYCWGAGRSGQLGNGLSSDSPRPVLVVGGHVFRDLALGLNHSCGLAADGITRCWGSNGRGQVGSLAARSVATPLPVLVRPAPRASATGLFVTSTVRESFADGNYTSAPAWLPDSARASRIGIVDGALEVARRGSRGGTAATGVSLPVRMPITRSTQIQFDVQVLADSARRGCGLNCASWPALVRLRVKNNDLTESEVWYAFGDTGGASRTLGSVVIVARGDVTAGQWLREQRFTIRDAAPRADTILQVSLGGVGTDFAARYDNVVVPVPQPATLEVLPDAIMLTTTQPYQLRATARDASSAELPWIRPTFTSGDTSVARVDSLGMVTAVKSGRAVIRASIGAVTDSVRVTVRLPVRPVRSNRRP